MTVCDEGFPIIQLVLFTYWDNNVDVLPEINHNNKCKGYGCTMRDVA